MSEDRIAKLEKTVAEHAAVIAKLRAALGAGGASHEAASATDLDGKYGNPSVRKDPPKWSGQSFVGRTFSECPADYLESLAGFLEWRAEREASDPAKEKYARYSRSDAARARGWAARIRSGWTAPPEPPSQFAGGGFASPGLGDEAESFGEGDEIPF